MDRIPKASRCWNKAPAFFRRGAAAKTEYYADTAFLVQSPGYGEAQQSLPARRIFKAGIRMNRWRSALNRIS